MPVLTLPKKPPTATGPDLEFPRTSGSVEVHEPTEPDAPWVVQRGEAQHFRVGADLGRLIRALDGSRDHEQLAHVLGDPWTSGDIDTAVRQLADSRLLDDGTPPRKVRRIKLVPPATIQFTVLRPDRVLQRMLPLIRLLAHRSVSAAATAVALGGLLALAVCAPQLGDAVSRPMEMSAYLAVLFGVIGTTAVHEFAHGAVLTHHGGRPTRMGFMLFYMSPAFFCDVSDGWRLGKAKHRVQIALAGVFVQAVAAGAAAVAALFTGSGSGLREPLLVFALTTYITCAVNLLPLVKLDGYIALMSHLDISHLREKAMTDALCALSKFAFGGRYRRELPDKPWAVAYGFACMLFPLYLVGTALTLWSGMLQRLGVTGAVCFALGLGYLLFRVGKGWYKLAVTAKLSGANPYRILGVCMATAALLGAAATGITVPATVSAGYTVAADGSVSLVVPEGAGGRLLKEGAHVQLRRNGLLSRPPLTTGRLTSSTSTPQKAPLSALVPVSGGSDLLPVRGYPLSVAAVPAERSGVAEVDAGSHPLWKWLAVTYLTPVLP
ncbi:daptide biosynthesis intramembrane metalloprotease [Streptomyces sp. NRRL S-87]|uniref:daptide biosynthesis intramembrane metalloprotease n=1 Tax=Streptomyces sp. NRRL S-87 TaxID=1463920 RepID=UPI00068F985E|nr:daptide biosynthesis intramembrane metalloprotease [Streptomyces sp. NRRL S-87]